MDQKHIEQAEEMADKLREIMFDLHLMRYRMHSHFHLLVGSTLAHMADLAMAAAVKIEKDVQQEEQAFPVPVGSRWLENAFLTFVSERFPNGSNRHYPQVNPELMSEFTSWFQELLREGK